MPCVPRRFRRRRSNVPSDEAPPNRLSILPTVETCRVGNEGSPPAACVHRQAADGSALRPRGPVDPPDSPDGAESRCCPLLNDELPTASAEGLHRQRAPGHPLLFVTRLLRGRGKHVSTSLLTIASDDFRVCRLTIVLRSLLPALRKSLAARDKAQHVLDQNSESPSRIALELEVRPVSSALLAFGATSSFRGAERRSAMATATRQPRAAATTGTAWAAHEDIPVDRTPRVA